MVKKTFVRKKSRNYVAKFPRRIVTRAMQKFIDAGATVRFFNVSVELNRIQANNGTRGLVGHYVEPDEPVDLDMPNDNQQLDTDDETDEPVALDMSDDNQQLDSDASLPITSKKTLLSPSIERPIGKSPFYLKGRRPKNGHYRSQSKVSDSRRFTFG